VEAVVDVSGLSRRGFVVGGLAAGALAGPLSWLSPSRALAATTGTSNRLARSALTPHLQQKFRIIGHGRRVTATLVSIGDVMGAPKGAEKRFSAMLRAPRGHRLEQDVYHLSRAGYGAVRVLVVPVERGLKANLYQVIVNNL
jgi:hypothetical protein